MMHIQSPDHTNNNVEPQCMKDSKILLQKYGKTTFVGIISALAGALLCILSTPEPRIYHNVPIYNYTKLAAWASSRETPTLDRAAEVCPSGGRALKFMYNTSQNPPDFEVECEAPRLSRRAYVTLGITVTALCLMISGSPPDLCMLAATLVLVLWPWKDTGSGIITESEAWQGFSNKGVLTVGALFVVAKAVDETGIVSLVMKRVLGEPKSLFLAQLRLLLPVAVSSAFMNNTPIVAMLIPVVIQWAPRIGRRPSTFLMPLSFASMLGGMCSMMGTSTNLVVAGLLAKKNPEMTPFGLFDIAVVGGPCALIGILYMAVFSGCLLPGGGGTEQSGGTELGDKTESEEVEIGVATTIQERNHVPRSYVVYFVVPSSSSSSSSPSQNSSGGSGSSASKRASTTSNSASTATTASLSSSTTINNNTITSVTPVDYGLTDTDMLRGGVFLEGILRDLDTFDGVGGSFRAPTSERSLYRPETGEWKDAELAPGDMLAVRVMSTTLAPLRNRLSRQGVRLLSELPTLRRGKRQGRRRNLRFLAEAVVGKDCPLLGCRKDVDAIGDEVMESYGAALVSIRDEGPRKNTRRRGWSSVSSRHVGVGTGHRRTWSSNSAGGHRTLLETSTSTSDNNNETLSSSLIVSVGDVLLVEVFPRCVEDMSKSDFTLVTAVPGSKPPRTGTTMDVVRMYVAGITLTAMVLLSALKITSLLTAALCASAVLLLFKTITLRAAFAAVNGRTLLAIVTTFGVGTAFENTGLAHHIASGLIGVFGSLGSVGVLLSVAVVTSVVGCAVSNNAVVILMYPICVTLARDFDGVNLRQLLVVLLVGASSSFLTPMSYQTNLMVFTPGKYQFSDYAKFGAGLQLSMLICSVFMAWLTADYWH